ncbi:tetracycline resistance protein [Acrasis kona]|uniref:Tetracycline resistance protein n=1 Tax=Acrasis kona TaxID=1008807 RepID=A0AAW2ZQY2_9EUKA
MSKADNMRSYRNKIFTLLLLDSLCVGINVPVLPQMVTYQMKQDVSVASSYFGLIMSMTALINFVVSPLVGALSDKYGRKKLLLFSTYGSSLHYFILFLAMYFFQDVRGIYMIILGRIVSGITAHSIMLSFAYISDISDRKNRAQYFGLIGTSFGIAFLIGPALGGILGSKIHLSVPFALTSTIQFLNATGMLFFLKESLHLQDHTASPEDSSNDTCDSPLESEIQNSINEESKSDEIVFNQDAKHHHSGESIWKRANPLNSFDILLKDPFATVLSLAMLFNGIAQTGFQNVWVHYTNHRFGWSTLQCGLFFTIGGVFTAIVQGYMLKHIVASIGERKCVYYGFILSTILNLLLSVINQGWMLYPLIPFNALSGVSLPAMRAQMTKQSQGSHVHGALQGALASLQTLSRIIGPLLTTNLFRYVTSEKSLIAFEGAPFLLCAFLEFVSLGFIVYAFNSRFAGKQQVE